MSGTINIFIILFFSLNIFNSKIVYIFYEKTIFNMTQNTKINGTELEIFQKGEYLITGNCEISSILINANYVTLYIINSHLNSVLKPLIIVNENKKNIHIYLKEAILSSSYDPGIIEVKKDSNLIIHSKLSIFKGGIIIKGQKHWIIK